jgi:N-acyl-D-amino-acid deacylase
MSIVIVKRGGKPSPPGRRSAERVRARRLPLTLLPAVLAVVSAALPVRASDAFSAAEAVVRAAVANGAAPGAAFVVARGGAIVHEAAFGVADRATNRAMTPTTPFTLASVSKVLTAIAVMQLVDAKKLALDDRAYGFFADLTQPAGTERDPRLASITIRDLLLHAGGWDRTVSGSFLDDTATMRAKLGLATPYVTPLDAIRYSLGVSLDFTPGTKQVYSNVGYVVLSEIVARASGESYEAYVKAHVLAPAGVTEGSLHHGAGARPGEAARYLANGTRYDAPFRPQVEGAGDWVLSAVDMVKVVLALERGVLLSRASYDAMFAPPLPPFVARPNGSAFGFGWDGVTHVPAGVRYAKNGSLPGVRTVIEHRADGTIFALFLNGGEANDGEAGAPARAVDAAL